MPGKVNPVIPEAVTQAALVVLANDQALTMACSMGSLELNPFLPLVADALLGSLHLLAAACSVFRRLCVEGIEADEARCRAHVHDATATVTALVEALGYEKATAIALAAQSERRPLRAVALERGGLTGEQFDALISPQRVTQLGSRKHHGTRGAP